MDIAIAKWSYIGISVSSICLWFSVPSSAQVIPDNTLDTESSVVNPRDATSEKIDGGALRGQNLFHSFQEFNVDAGRGVYFTNPDAVTNIFSRVTGNNISNILGTLGVDGAANLFLINPNGIIFGKDASLDIQGSFTATTADGIEFGDRGFFSAIQPEQSSLLTISPSAFFYNQVANQPGNIINRGNLVTGQDLTLNGNNLDLQGQIWAGENLTLSALDTVKIRDSLDNPFIGVARGNLLIRGDRAVNIFTLSHPESGLFSGQDLVLQSANPVAGDAHFWSGGSFRVEQLDGNLGSLKSPNDPIIRSLGDVSFDVYSGSSLHILAGGSVNIGSVIITQPEIGTVNSDFIRETITLSNNTEILIDGSDRPTLDIRAGVEPAIVGSLQTTGFDFSDIFLTIPNISDTASSADITIGEVAINTAKGKVFLSNQYQPNLSLPGGEIVVTGVGLLGTQAIDVSNFLEDGGDVILDSRGGIQLDGDINTIGSAGKGGDVTLIAQDGITLNKSVTANGLLGGNVNLTSMGDISITNGAVIDVTADGFGNAGAIALNSNSLFLTNSSRLNTSNRGQGNAGNILIQAKDRVLVSGSGIFSNIGSVGGLEARGNVGVIEIKTNSASFTNGSQLQTVLFSGGQGKGGLISINAREEVTLTDDSIFFANSDLGSSGDASDIEITANSVLLNNKSTLNVSNAGDGNAGNILIQAKDRVLVSDSNIFSNIGSFAGLQSRGNVGTIKIEANSVSFNNGSQIQAGFFAGGQGEGGLISIKAQENITLAGNSSFFANTAFGANGDASNIEITANLVSLTNSSLFTSNDGAGNAGNTTILANNDVSLNNSNISTDATNGRSGDIDIISNALIIDNGSILGGQGSGTGAGNIFINTTEFVNLHNGSIISAFASDSASGGDITIDTKKLSVRNESSLLASVFADRPAGNITVNASESVELTQASSFALTTEGDGNAGSLTINTDELLLSGGSQLSTTTFLGKGAGGNITINSSKSVKLTDTTPDGLGTNRIDASSSGEGQAGTIKITTGELLIDDGSGVSSFTLANGRGGDIKINASELVVVRGVRPLGFFPSTIDTSSDGSGLSGNINIVTKELKVLDGGQITAVTQGENLGGIIDIFATDSIEVAGNRFSDIFGSEVTVESFSKGNAGSIILTTSQLIVRDGGQILARTLTEGDAGKIFIQANDLVTLNRGSISTGTLLDSIGQGGEINFTTKVLNLDNGASITSFSQGQGNAGNINIDVEESLTAIDSNISTDALQASGGEINIQSNTISLRSNTNIITNVLSGSGGGGNIKLTADSIIAFDDSDIFAFAQDGQGGNITLDTPAFFGENFTLNSLTSDPNNLEGNSRVDLNATGAVAGVVSIPDVSFIQNSLTELPDNSINTDELVANSCVVPVGNRQQGQFIITGSDGLPSRPGSGTTSSYPTGKVRSIPESNRSWQPGDPVIEPQGIYRLTNGNLVLSRECHK